MRIIINNNESQIEARKISIELSEDVSIDISIQHGELIVRKAQFGDGPGSINISPKVSNEIGIS